MSRMRLYLMIVPLVLPGVASAQTAGTPVVAVSFKSVDGLIADLKFMAPFVEQENLPAEIDAFLKEKAGGLDGVDRKKPVSACVLWPDKVNDSGPLNAPVLVLVPITDEGRFLGLLGKLGCKSEKGEGGVYRLTAPELPELFLRVAQGHAYVSTARNPLKGQLPDPDSLLPPGARQTTIAAVLRLDPLAADYKKAIDLLVESGVEGLKKLEEEDPPSIKELQGYVKNSKTPLATFALLRGFLAGLADHVKNSKTPLATFAEQTRQVALSLDIDSKGQKVVLDLVVDPRAKGELAGFCEYAAGSRSRFSYLVEETPAGLWFHLPPPGNPRKLAPKDLTEMSGLMQMFIEPKYQDLVQKGIQAFLQTISVDGFDVCVVGCTPGADTSALIGVKLQEGGKLDAALRDWYKKLSAADREGVSVRWNHDKHADARIHKCKIPDDEDDYFLAIRDDVAFLGLGKDSLAHLKKALDGFGKKTTETTPLLRVQAGALLFKEKELAQAVEKAGVPKEDRDKLNARLMLQGGKNLKLHLEVNAYLLKVLGKLPE